MANSALSNLHYECLNDVLSMDKNKKNELLCQIAYVCSVVT